MTTFNSSSKRAHNYESATEYFNNPISAEDLEDMREFMNSLLPKTELFSKLCLIALICTVASFLITLLVINLNTSQWIQESVNTKWVVVAHIFTAVLVVAIWTSASDIFIPPESELSIKIGKVDYLRIPSMQGGMINQLEPTNDSRVNEWKHIPRVARFIQLLNGRKVLNFEKQLIASSLLTKH